MENEIEWVEYSKHEEIALYRSAILKVNWYKGRTYSWSCIIAEMPFMFGFGDSIESAQEQAINAAKNALTTNLQS